MLIDQDFLWPQLVNVSVGLKIFPPDIVVFLSQNRQMPSGNTNLLPSPECLFQRECDDDSCVSSNVAWDSDCKQLWFIVKRWQHSPVPSGVLKVYIWEGIWNQFAHIFHAMFRICFFCQSSVPYITQNFELFIWRHFTHYKTCKVDNMWYFRYMGNRTLIRWQPLSFLTTTLIWFIIILSFFMHTHFLLK